MKQESFSYVSLVYQKHLRSQEGVKRKPCALQKDERHFKKTLKKGQDSSSKGEDYA